MLLLHLVSLPIIEADEEGVCVLSAWMCSRVFLNVGGDTNSQKYQDFSNLNR
jgi:hypothetical protein